MKVQTSLESISFISGIEVSSMNKEISFIKQTIENLQCKIRSQLLPTADQSKINLYFSSPTDIRAAQYVRSMGGNAADLVEYRKTMELLFELTFGEAIRKYKESEH